MRSLCSVISMLHMVNNYINLSKEGVVCIRYATIGWVGLANENEAQRNVYFT